MRIELSVAVAFAGTLLATCFVSGSAQATSVPVLKSDAGMVTLVGRGGGAMVCRQKSAALKTDARDATRDRHAIHMHVHRREENADLQPLARRRGRGFRRSGDQHPAVRRRQHDVVGRADLTIRIAEKEEEEPGEDEQRNGKSPTDREGSQDGGADGADDEGEPGGVDTH